MSDDFDVVGFTSDIHCIELHVKTTLTSFAHRRAVVVSGFRHLLSQQRARNAEATTTEAEEVIRSRPETPKLLKTVIKVRHFCIYSQQPES